MLGALLKQAVSGMAKVGRKLRKLMKARKSGRTKKRLQFGIAKILQITYSSFGLMLAMNAYKANRVKLLDSLNEIIRKSPGARTFLTKRPQFLPKVRRRLANKVMNLSITPG